MSIHGPMDDWNGVPDDEMLRMLSFYLKSAGGDGVAARHIGNLYRSGQSVPQSAAKAWAWFDLAAERGAGGARQDAAAMAALWSEAESKAGHEYRLGVEEDLKQVTPFLMR